MPTAYVSLFQGVEATPVTTVAGTGSAITSVSTFIGPRNLLYGTKVYDCTAGGLYRFWAPLGTGGNRIVWDGDIDRLMAAIASVTALGTEDEALTVSQQTARAGASQLRLRCGKTCEWAKAVCDSVYNVCPQYPPVQARIVRALTSEQPNDWFDGHVMLEVKHPDGWRLYDLAMGRTYGSSPLPLKDALPLQTSTPRPRLCVKSFTVAPPAVGGAFDASAWSFLRMTNEADWAADMERVLQIPGIDDAGLTWFYLPPGMESRAAWVLSLSTLFRVLPKAEWMARFYPQ